ncbi:MAG TPA: secretin N-terminal domain-containing protein [Vicinamibacteria bacterium]|jgi:general secretion pathway protein D|nr:secretin N-terminal domain-containing protein [Vicinamibacteria bacterium]
MRRLAAFLLVLPLLGCASSSAFRKGEVAERSQDYDKAILEYSRAIQKDPANVHYRASLSRVRVRASEAHALAARRSAARGLFKEALDEYQLALNLNPGAVGLTAEVQETQERAKARTHPASGEELRAHTREHFLTGLSLPPSAREPLGISVRNASLRDTFLALGKSVGVNVIFDPQFQDSPVTLDLTETPFEQALAALAGAGKVFYTVVDPRVVMVHPDTAMKRKEYEQQIVKTFFLSNADLKETVDLLRIVLGARRIAPAPADNAFTINDTPDKVAAAERIVEALDKKRGEVIVDVEILEVNRDLLKDYGIELTSSIQGGTGIAGGIFPNPTGITTLEQNPYQKSNLIISNLPGVIYRLLSTDTSTRLLANPQLRMSEGQTAQARFGEMVPVPVTTFSPIAQGGISQQPITSFEYKNVGVNIDVTPRVHQDGEVTLSLKFDISSLGPAGFQGLPTFNSRIVTSVIRLRDGETNILAGLINDQERISLTGIPGLEKIPFLGRLFARNNKQITRTDIVMTLTPHVVREPELKEEDLRSFVVGGEIPATIFEAPSGPVATPIIPLKSPEPAKSEPIRPPSPVPSPGTGFN